MAPLTLISLMMIGGWMARGYKWGRKWGQRVLGGGIGLLILCGFFPIGHNLLVYQENQYPVMTQFPPKVDGIIVLGGSIDLDKSVSRGQGQLNEHAPRITEMIVLARQYPRAQIIFTGGNGSLRQSASSEAVEMTKLLNRIGFESGRILYEDQSRNTYENMVFSKNMIKPRTGDVWLLVTSAFHMRRSSLIFMSNDWAIIPYPAGYLTNGHYQFIPNFQVLENMYKLQIVAKEMIGIMAYTLTGKIKLNEKSDSSSFAPDIDLSRRSE